VRARITGGVLIALAVLVCSCSTSRRAMPTFRLSRPRDPLAMPNLVVPGGRSTPIMAAMLAFLGARQFLRGGGRWTTRWRSASGWPSR
jgi:hypothetical protein